MGLFSRRIKRIGVNRYKVDLPESERDLLAHLLPQLRDLLSTDDPSITRLFPTAYANDPERDAGYHALVRDELLERRYASIDIIESTLAGGELDGDALSGWMRAVNDLRLVVGTRLDVSEEDDPSDIDPDDPDAGLWQIYHYLGMLLVFIVDAMAQDLPAGDDSDAPG